MSEYIEVGQPLQFTDPNTPTRVGEIVENVSDIYNIPSPRLGMQVFVKSEKKSFVITSLKSKVIGGVDVPEAAVEAFEPVGAKSITWNNDTDPSNMNDFVVAGVYDIKGERKRDDDNLPILNHNPGHTFNARLTVLDSSITGTNENDDKCITQVLSFSNRLGQGEVYIRTGKGSSLDNLTWEKWSTLQRNVNVVSVESLDELIDNGIYSGVLNPTGETFVLVVINNYALASKHGIERSVSQFKYSVDHAGVVSFGKRVKKGDGAFTNTWDIINSENIYKAIEESLYNAMHYTDETIKKLVGEAPDTLDSLQEIANWVTTHEDLYTILKSIAEQNSSKLSEIESLAIDGSRIHSSSEANLITIDYGTIGGGGGSVTIPAATTEKAGIMTANDKVTLNASIKNVEVSPDTDEVELGLEDNTGKITHVAIPAATAESAGVMSAKDKIKLDAVNDDHDDELYITDKNGNVVAKISKEGLDAVGLFINGKKVQDTLEIDSIIESRAEDRLVLTDKNGNIVVDIDKDGIHAVEGGKKDKSYINSLYGKKLVTMGDSLFAGGQFGKKLAELSGAIWDEKLNNNHYSVGGTRTVSFSDTCGQGRAKKLIEEGLAPDVILYANTNDANIYSNLGSKDDESWFRHNVVKSNITPLTSSSEALAYFDNNFTSIVGSITPAVGTMLGIPYSVNTGIRLTILSAPVKEGDIKITLSGTGQGTVNIHVLQTDTIEDVINKIVEYDYNNYIDEKESTSSVLFSTPSSSPTLTIDPVTTGVTYRIDTGINANLYSWKYFVGHDVSKWNNPSNWVTQVSLWASWKGLAEYILNNLPNVMLYFFFPKTYGVDYTSETYKRADGTLDWDKIYVQNSVRRKLYDAQKEFCEYYEIPYLDMQVVSVLNVGNMETFMNVNNVHPKQEAYERWAEVTNRMLN